MSALGVLLGILCAVGIAGGQVLLKLATAQVASLSSVKSMLHDLLNLYFLMASVVYVMTSLVWIWLLSLVPLKHAYPLIALAFLIVPFLARLFLREKLEVGSIIGGLIIMIGVYVSAR
jgi:drug/metabolite transporter (DMT)-like permease